MHLKFKLQRGVAGLIMEPCTSKFCNNVDFLDNQMIFLWFFNQCFYFKVTKNVWESAIQVLSNPWIDPSWYLFISISLLSGRFKMRVSQQSNVALLTASIWRIPVLLSSLHSSFAKESFWDDGGQRLNLITSFWTLVLTVASSNVKIKLPRTCKVEYILIEGFI